MSQYELYSKNILVRKVILPFSTVGKNIDFNIKQKLLCIEGKCAAEGYIKPNSINIISYSSGIINSNNIHFNVSFNCLICNPVEGMTIKCFVKNVTKAGIRAEIKGKNSPIIIFIARDHHINHKIFSNIKENDTISINVVGKRYELNDEFISIIGELK